MSNDLTMFKGSNAPAHVASFFSEEGNIDDRQTVPSLSYEGKVWTIALNGEKTPLIRKNADGDDEPVSIMQVVVVDYAKRRGRTFYEGEYDPKNVSAPVCWSDDGVTPDSSIPDEIKQNKTSFKCDTCPMSVKGSKVTAQGKPVQACSQHRMLAVVPAHKLDFEPLRLKIAVTSDYDKQSPEAEAQGWRAFSQYLDFLRSQGVQHTGALVTKIKFDSTAQYPKLFFAPSRWLEANEIEQIRPLTNAEGVKQLLGGTWTPAGVDGKRTTTPAEPKAKAPSNPEPEEVPTKKIEAEKVEVQTEEEVVVTTSNKKTPPVEEAPAATTELPDEVASLLDEWGDD